MKTVYVVFKETDLETISIDSIWDYQSLAEYRVDELKEAEPHHEAIYQTEFEVNKIVR